MNLFEKTNKKQNTRKEKHKKNTRKAKAIG
jgi:hypothetical protein